MVYWVFGYGSLIWKPPPHAVEKRSGYVKSVLRRFAQSSIDHRGIPEAPGRVVTVIKAQEWHSLVEDYTSKHSPSNGVVEEIDHPVEEDIVWGVCYRIDPEKEEEVMAYLDHREKNGYTSHEVPVYQLVTDPETNKQVEKVCVDDATIYIGQLSNPAFIGYEPLSSISKTIHKSIGPSGPNKEYLYQLAQAVRELYPDVKDDYLFELERSVRALDERVDEGDFVRGTRDGKVEKLEKGEEVEVKA